MSDRWPPRAILAAALFVAIAVVQVGVPVRQFVEPRPARFGWHMYSNLNPPPLAWVEGADGERTEVDVMQVLGDTRAEISWSGPLAERLCADDDVLAVIVFDRALERRVPCQ
jgi:hypothetical protein